MSGSEFVFDAVNVLYYDLNKMSLNRGGSYIPTFKWLDDKKATINPRSDDNKCCMYSLVITQDYKEIGDHPERISTIKAILLMITDGKKWHYLAVTRLSALLRGITSKHNGDFYSLNSFRAYTTRIRLERHKNVCENHDYCRVEMPNEYNKILKYNYGEKSIRAPFIMYADLESLLKKMSTCYDSPEKSSTTKINKHTPSGYSLFTHCSFDEPKSKIDYYRVKNCIKIFCLDKNN